METDNELLPTQPIPAIEIFVDEVEPEQASEAEAAVVNKSTILPQKLIALYEAWRIRVGLWLIAIGFLMFLFLIVKSGYNIATGGVAGKLLTSAEIQSNNTLYNKFSSFTNKPSGKTQSNKFNWQKADNLLASTPSARKRAIKKLRLESGENFIAVFSINCSECDSAAERLNQSNNKENIVAIAIANQAQVDAWKKKHGLNYRVIGVSKELFEDLGGVLYPTFIYLKDGELVGASWKVETLL